jgi:hypothetical protein
VKTGPQKTHKRFRLEGVLLSLTALLGLPLFLIYGFGRLTNAIPNEQQWGGHHGPWRGAWQGDIFHYFPSLLFFIAVFTLAAALLGQVLALGLRKHRETLYAQTLIRFTLFSSQIGLLYLFILYVFWTVD